jgi:hypothetical protein
MTVKRCVLCFFTFMLFNMNTCMNLNTFYVMNLYYVIQIDTNGLKCIASEDLEKHIVDDL